MAWLRDEIPLRPGRARRTPVALLISGSCSRNRRPGRPTRPSPADAERRVPQAHGEHPRQRDNEVPRQRRLLAREALEILVIERQELALEHGPDGDSQVATVE